MILPEVYMCRDKRVGGDFQPSKRQRRALVLYSGALLPVDSGAGNPLESLRVNTEVITSAGARRDHGDASAAQNREAKLPHHL